jgi:hypothetical protein
VQTGTEKQIAEAKQVLRDATRLYKILADGDEGKDA